MFAIREYGQFKTVHRVETRDYSRAHDARKNACRAGGKHNLIGNVGYYRGTIRSLKCWATSASVTIFRSESYRFSWRANHKDEAIDPNRLMSTILSYG